MALADLRAQSGSDIYTVLEESDVESQASTVQVGPAKEREEPAEEGVAGGSAATPLPEKELPGVERVDLELSPEAQPDPNRADLDLAPTGQG